MDSSFLYYEPAKWKLNVLTQKLFKKKKYCAATAAKYFVEYVNYQLKNKTLKKYGAPRRHLQTAKSSKAQDI